jgi:hypothetical protein
MKRFVIITLLYNLINISLCAQEVFIYYEGPKVYSEKQYAYEFQSLILTHSSENPIYEIKDSVFISFLDKKVESIERCTNEGECFDATDKPFAMIQVVYMKDLYCYYTLNLNSTWRDKNYLTIDGKSCVPDKELQDVITEIVKFCVINKQSPTDSQLHDIMTKKLTTDARFWPCFN